eukprot:992936-Pelagomonas_calceolata.AAC.1
MMKVPFTSGVLQRLPNVILRSHLHLGCRSPSKQDYRKGLESISFCLSTAAGLPGRIHVSETTHNLLQHAEHWEATGGVEVKGKVSAGMCTGRTQENPFQCSFLFVDPLCLVHEIWAVWFFLEATNLAFRGMGGLDEKASSRLIRFERSCSIYKALLVGQSKASSTSTPWQQQRVGWACASAQGQGARKQHGFPTKTKKFKE